MWGYRRQKAAALRAGRRILPGERQEISTAWMQQAVGLGGVNSKAVSNRWGSSVSPRFPNSPRGTPLPALELHTQTNNKPVGKRSPQGPGSAR